MGNIEELIQSSKYSEALDLLKSQISVQPDNNKILSKIGYCFFKIGRINEAEKYFKKASVLCDDDWIWQQYGFILYKLGKLTESIKAIKEAVKCSPDNIWYFHQLAFLLLKTRDFENSVYYIDKAVKLAEDSQSSDYFDLLEFKAEIYENINKDKALEIYFSLIDKFENNPILYDKTANVVVNQFKFSKKLDNLNLDTYEYNKATLLLRKGNVNKAVKLYKKILAGNKYCYPAYLGIAQALYEQKFGILDIGKVPTPAGISDLFKNYSQLNAHEKNIINASVLPFENFISELNKRNSEFFVVPVDVRLVDYPANNYLKRKKYQNMPFCTLRGIGGDNGFVGVERLRDILWDVPDNIPVISACAAHEYGHLVWCILDDDTQDTFNQLYNLSKMNNSFISNYSAYNVEEFFAEYYAYYTKLLAANKPVPDNPVMKKLQELQ